MMAAADVRTPGLCRALPGWAVDTILFGIPEKEARDGRRMYGACVGIAMSAQVRGWGESEYLTEISSRTTGLWRQLTTRRDGRPRADKVGYKELRTAWRAAVLNLNGLGTRTRDQVAADAVELAFMWVDRLTDGTDDLSETEANVMRYVVAETERRGMLRVTCPGREVAEFAKVPHRTAARVLAWLTACGLLIKHSPGRRGRAGSSGRAAIYGLVDPGSIGT